MNIYGSGNVETSSWCRKISWKKLGVSVRLSRPISSRTLRACLKRTNSYLHWLHLTTITLSHGSPQTVLVGYMSHDIWLFSVTYFIYVREHWICVCAQRRGIQHGHLDWSVAFRRTRGQCTPSNTHHTIFYFFHVFFHIWIFMLSM